MTLEGMKVDTTHRETVSITIDSMLPHLEKAIREELDLDESVELHFVSNTKFMLFNVIRDNKQRNQCNCKNCIK